MAKRRKVKKNSGQDVGITKKTKEEEYKDNRSAHRAATPRHVLKLEVDMDEDTKRKVAGECNKLRMAGNRLTGFLQERLHHLFRNPAYIDLKDQYSKTCKKMAGKKEDDPELEGLQKELKAIGAEMNAMQEQYGVTFIEARKYMEELQQEMGLHSVFGLTRAEDVWQGVEAVLYKDGESLSFLKKGDLPIMRAKQIERGIPIHVEEGQLKLSVSLPATKQQITEKFKKDLAKLETERGGSLPQCERDQLKHDLKLTYRKQVDFGLIVKKNDIFAHEEIENIVKFLSDPNAEQNAVDAYVKTKKPQNTFRPCYATLSCETIRGKLRVFCHITIEGLPCTKKNKKGTRRHAYGTGVCGVDLGPQTVDLVTDKKVIAANLAERNGRSTFELEAQEKELQRAMDRSRRATNPEYYNPDGTIKKGKKHWKYSKRYKKLRAKHRDLCRKNALNRHYAIQEMVNDIRAISDEIVIEPSNVKAMQRRAKSKEEEKEKTDDSKGTEVQSQEVTPAPAEDTSSNNTASSNKPSKKKGKKGKKAKKKSDKARHKSRGHGMGRRKRFGRSILNRCPGYFYARLKEVFEGTGGSFHIVDGQNFKASQYDHTTGQCTKKELSERWHTFPDGTMVQRDLYSAFLLRCSNAELTSPDRDLCIAKFDNFRILHDACLEDIEARHIKIRNFGKKSKKVI